MDALKELSPFITCFGSMATQSKICTYDNNEGIPPNFILDCSCSQHVTALILLAIQEDNKQSIMLGS